MPDDFTEALADVLATLPPEEAARAVRQMRAWLNFETAVHRAEVADLGPGFGDEAVRVAPYHRPPLAERLGQEVRRREALGDITAVVWSRWAELAAVE